MKKIAILSIDGGGIRGILPATVLFRLEGILQKLSGKPDLKIGDCFDLVAGTSTGGILSCIYLAPDPTPGKTPDQTPGNTAAPSQSPTPGKTPAQNRKARYSAQDALNLYVDHGHEIFDRTEWWKVKTLEGFTGPKYSHEPLYRLLTQYFGDLKLADLIKPSLITSYEIAARRGVFFTSVDARTDDGSNFYVRDVARATSAAPTYFAPAEIQSDDKKYWSLVDGGVFANNPTLCAYSEALKIDFPAIFPQCDKADVKSARDMLIISLGTGSVKKMYHFEDFSHAGEIKWLEPIIDILMSGNSETVDYELKSIYGTFSKTDSQDYYRLEPPLLEASSNMDLATPENITKLKNAGLDFAEQNLDKLTEIAQKILKLCVGTAV